MSDDNRNPLIIPDDQPVASAGCPKCKAFDFSGRKVGGVLYFTCRKCGAKWEGGLPMVPADPRDPIPIEPAQRPTSFFDIDPKSKQVKELRRRVDTTQEFRKGAPFPEGEDDV